jgi:hypothetical protein
MESSSFSIHRLTIDPEVSDLGGPVRIQMEFISPQPLSSAIWRVFYIVDTIRKRKKLEVTSLSNLNYEAGLNSLDLQIPSIDVDSLSTVTAGVLLLELTHQDEELLAINMIVQVMLKDGRKMKTIFSPLE